MVPELPGIAEPFKVAVVPVRFETLFVVTVGRVGVGVFVGVFVGVVVGVGVGEQFRIRIETLLELKFVAAMSCLLSPLKSPTAMEIGRAPTVTPTGDPKLPVPLPSIIETVLTLRSKFAAAMSCLPSPLKSPTTTE